MEISFGGQAMEIVDLTLPLSLETEVFPGDPPVSREVFAGIQETGFEHYVHRLGDHVFTPHADAPKHQNPDCQEDGVEVWGPEYEFNRALLIDLQSDPGAIEIDSIRFLPRIERSHLEPHENEIRAVTAVVVRTGIEEWRLAGRSFRPETVPGFSADAGEYLAGHENLRVIGTDSLTVDVVRPESPIHSVHQSFKRKLIVESLTHLGRIPKRDRPDFLLQTALVKIQGATGCPVVARAFLERG